MNVLKFVNTFKASFLIRLCKYSSVSSSFFDRIAAEQAQSDICMVCGMCDQLLRRVLLDIYLVHCSHISELGRQ